MLTYVDPGIRFDTVAYQPMRIMGVTHELMGHPLLQLPNLLELAKRLQAKNSVRSHGDTADAGTDFHSAPETHPAPLSPEETIRRIEEAKAWLSLLNIQNDPVYRKLVDEVLDYVRPEIDRKDPGMCHRAGWIFIASPGAVTPYHFDHEHNFILQVLGKKDIYVFDPLDRSIVSEEALELFHFAHLRDRLKHSEEIQKKAHVFHAEPGVGAYMPTTAPHWVKNGDNVSITVSFTFYTRETIRRKLLHIQNHRLRQLGLNPTPVGASRVRDEAKYRIAELQQSVKLAASRLRGGAARALTSRYAVA